MGKIDRADGLKSIDSQCMYYEIDKTRLQELIEEEVSHIADDAYSDDGTPLYDSIVLTEKDRPLVDRFIDDAVSQFVQKEFDVTKYDFSSEMPRLEFHVPDFDHSMENAFKNELSRYISLFACMCICLQRRAALVPEYTDRSKTAMEKAIALLKTRKHPVTKW